MQEIQLIPQPIIDAINAHADAVVTSATLHTEFFNANQTAISAHTTAEQAMLAGVSDANEVADILTSFEFAVVGHERARTAYNAHESVLIARRKELYNAILAELSEATPEGNMTFRRVTHPTTDTPR